MYYSGIMGPNPLICGRKKGYVINVTQLELMPPVEQLVQNQYLIRIPTSRLKQLVPIVRGVPIQQTIATTLPVNIHVTTRLPVYGNGVPIQQPKRANSNPQLGGKSLGNSPNGGLLVGGTLD
jgi:hypothetical protein